MNKEQAANSWERAYDAETSPHTTYVTVFLAGVEWRDENPGWVRVEDGPPEYDKQVLWLMDDGNVYVYFLDKDDPYPFQRITHWMYFPSLPNTTK
jgi:hypothetical protein